MASEHVTVIETASYMGAVPETIDTRFCIFLPDDPAPYHRPMKLLASEEWTPLDTGWVDHPAMILIKHDTYRGPDSVVTTPRTDPDSPEVTVLRSASGLEISVSAEEIAQARSQAEYLQQLARSKHLCVLEVGIETRVDPSTTPNPMTIWPFAEIPPGQSLRWVPSLGMTYHLRLRHGTGKESIYVIPKKVEEEEAE